MGASGKIVSVKAKADGVVVVTILDGGTTAIGKSFGGTPEAIKNMVAMALTAKVSNLDVTLATGGTDKWQVIVIE